MPPGVPPNAAPACVTTGAAPFGIQIPLDRPLEARRWFGFLSYQTPAAVTVQETGGDVVRIPKGSGTLITDFPPIPLSSVGWGVPARHRLCITGLRIVFPRGLTSGYPPVKPLKARHPPPPKRHRPSRSSTGSWSHGHAPSARSKGDTPVEPNLVPQGMSTRFLRAGADRPPERTSDAPCRRSVADRRRCLVEALRTHRDSAMVIAMSWIRPQI